MITMWAFVGTALYIIARTGAAKKQLYERTIVLSGSY